jgi:acyl-coenzyme A thioesterase PaaI-like protein
MDTYGRAEITKQGRRVATVRAEAWQDDRSRPIAAAHGHFLLQAADDAPT